MGTSIQQAEVADNSRVLNNVFYLSESVCLFKQPKTPIGRKLGISCSVNYLVQVRQYSPCKVLHYVAVHVLAGTIIRMQLKVSLCLVVQGEVMVYHTALSVFTASSVR